MDKQFDLVVVGTGVTSAAASRCREAGWNVAVVDRRPFGGTCALRGCVPKKILVGAAEAVQSARDLTGKGVPAGALAIDWPELVRFKRSLVDPTTERAEQTWARIGVAQFHGRARFVGPATLAVGDDQLTGRRILIAAGATSGFKVLIEEDTNHILGAHLLGPRADEVINLFALAIRLRVQAPELQQVLFAYPTSGSDVRFML